jgi:hypothetical protein
MEKYEKSMKECVAAAKDAAARMNGCSAYERRLREELPVMLYDYDPEHRETMINLKVIKYELSKPWWAR